MDNKIQYVELNGRKYKLQHPGVRQYLKMKQRLYSTVPISGTDEFSLQINEEALFDLSFGRKPQDIRVVFACDKGRDWVDYADEKVYPCAEKHTPTLKELTEVWSLVLQRFLGMQPVNDIRHEGLTWLDKCPAEG